MSSVRPKLDLGMPEEVETAVGTLLTVAGIIECARTAGTDRGDDLYDAFSESWDALSDRSLANDARANLAFEIAAEMIGCTIGSEELPRPN